VTAARAPAGSSKAQATTIKTEFGAEQRLFFGGSLRRTVSPILFRTRRRKKAEGEGQGRDSNRHERTTDELRKKVGQQAMLDGQRADGKPKRGGDQARGDYKTPAIFCRRFKRPIRAAAFSNGGRGKQHG